MHAQWRTAPPNREIYDWREEAGGALEEPVGSGTSWMEWISGADSKRTTENTGVGTNVTGVLKHGMGPTWHSMQQ